MRDITLADTAYFNFTTRSFSTGVPTQLAGSPVLSVLESNNATPITAGVSVEVDRASVTGLNQATVVATTANGYEAGKSYAIYISTGTVGGVSVVGEVVAQFTIQASAAAVDLANGTDGLGAIKGDTAAILLDTTEIGAAGAGLTNIGTIATVTNLTNLPATAALEATAQSILTDTAEIGVAGAGLTAINLPDQTMNITGNLSGSVGSVTGLSVAAILTTAITEAYRANGAAPTLAQFICEVLAHLGEADVTGTTKTIKKLDHSTTAETFTLDSSTAPTLITRST